MKILILNASPRRNGTISQAVERFADGVSNSFTGDFSEDVRVDVVNVNDLKFAACRGCMQCRHCGQCCLPEDDAHRVAEKIASCDVLVVAAPVYWGNMPGTLKMLFDRMVYALMGESKLGIPKPDLVIFLEMKPEISQRLVNSRAQQTGRKTDIHEKDPNYINNCYNAAKYTADNYGWKRITCFSGKEPLSPERIHAEVEKAVTYLLDVNG